MFFPIRDDNPHTKTPIVTWALIAACVAVFLWQKSLTGNADDIAVFSFGLIPADLFGTAEINPLISPLPAWMTIFTSMFLHGGWLHLGGNMLYLWIFGDNVEVSMGRGKFLLFYLACGLAAALTQSLAAPMSTVPMVGASGAVAGVLGAYFMLHPFANIRVLVWLIIFFFMINVPAWIVLGFWFLGQLISQVGANPGEPGVAFLAHIGGFITGLALIFKMRKPGVRLFARRATRPFEMKSGRAVRRRRGGSVPSSGRASGNRKGPWG
ncbi:MAG: rhomboid family intramembrane serine protease [Rhodospirillaceae bacterium]